MQPQELRKIIEGYNRRIKAEDYKKAYFVSWLVNCQTTKPVSQADIADPLYITAEDIAEKKKQDHAVLLEEFNIDNTNVEGGKA